MGGKTWNREEEDFFWGRIVPQSPKAARETDRCKSWRHCAELMRRGFGPKARRKYTSTMLSEHYFQNVATGHLSPFAGDHVVAHLRAIETEKKGTDVTSSECSTETEGALPMQAAPARRIRIKLITRNKQASPTLK